MSREKEPPQIVLIYRRTHTGDPSKDGVFGCNDCMKSVRGWKYDAVIGIGGKTSSKEMARKVNWIGIGPKKYPLKSREPLVAFSKFKLWDENPPLLSEYAPKLNKYMFEQGRIPHAGKNFPEYISKEVWDLLQLADGALDSRGNPEDILKARVCISSKSPNKCSSSCS